MIKSVKHNLFVGTILKLKSLQRKSIEDKENISMRFIQKKYFLQGEIVNAVYRKVPFSKISKTPYSKIKSGKFFWTKENGAQVALFERPSITGSTHWSGINTKKLAPGRYFVEYLSNDDTSVHEKVQFIIYKQLPEVNELKHQYMAKIVEILNKSPTSIDDLKKACGVPI